jgi:hypothetical protein
LPQTRKLLLSALAAVLPFSIVCWLLYAP